MLAGMSSAELTFWQCVAKAEFLGADRDDYRAARIESAIANFAGKSLKEGADVTPLDCMPYLPREGRKTRWTRKGAAKQIASVMAGFRK